MAALLRLVTDSCHQSTGNATKFCQRSISDGELWRGCCALARWSSSAQVQSGLAWISRHPHSSSPGSWLLGETNRLSVQGRLARAELRVTDCQVSIVRGGGDCAPAPPPSILTSRIVVWPSDMKRQANSSTCVGRQHVPRSLGAQYEGQRERSFPRPAATGLLVGPTPHY